VCMELLNRLCARPLPGAENIEYVVFPYVNERGRDLIMHLWPEMTGQYSRTYWDMMGQIPPQYWRTARLLFGGMGKMLNLEGLLPTVQCFDGSMRMTMLSNNFATGWQAREEVVQFQSFDYLSGSDLTIMDRTSTNGRMAYSDPETRIIQATIQKHLPDILIEVTLGTPAVLGPFDSQMLMTTQANSLSSAIRARFDASISQAASFAKHSCPEATCIGGSAANARLNADFPRTGTVGDFALMLGVSRAFVVQILANRQPANGVLNPDRSSNVLNCIGPKTLQTAEESSAHAARWCDLIELISHAPH
jgi:hypothetical protein